MSACLLFATFSALFVLALIGLTLLDRWHRQKAWRDAERGAREIMDRHHPDRNGRRSV